MNSHISWNQRIIPLKHSKRKTIGLYVKEGGIEVRAPKRVSKKEITLFLESKEHWLKNALEEQKKILDQRIDYSQAVTAPFMGQPLTLVFIEDSNSFWRHKEQTLTIGCPTIDASNVHSILADFYKHQAQFWLHNKTLALVEKLNLQHKLTDIGFRRTKTKWGHCTAKGKIQYNWLIMMAPMNVIDYLICHEASHLMYMDHSENFWNFVAEIHPTFKEDKHWLRENGHLLRL